MTPLFMSCIIRLHKVLGVQHSIHMAVLFPLDLKGDNNHAKGPSQLSIDLSNLASAFLLF